MQLNSPNSRCGEGWTSPLVDFSRNLLSLTLKHEAKHTQTVRALHLVSSSRQEVDENASRGNVSSQPSARAFSASRRHPPIKRQTTEPRSAPREMWKSALIFFFFLLFLNSEACVLHEESNANEWPLLGGEQSQIEIIQHVSTRADAPNGF